MQGAKQLAFFANIAPAVQSENQDSIRLQTYWTLKGYFAIWEHRCGRLLLVIQ
jgi:hypothetical protein